MGAVLRLISTDAFLGYAPAMHVNHVIIVI